MEPLQLVPLCSATLPVADLIELNDVPGGNLVIGEVVDSRWEGERLKASQRGRAAADWLLVSPDGTARVDVRLTLETDDGALIQVEYTGRTSLETNVACSAPTFRSGDPRYTWLNSVQAVAKGVFDPEAMVMRYPVVYELR